MERVVAVSIALIKAQPNMAPIARLASAVLEAASGCASVNEMLDRAEQAAQTFAENAVLAGEAAAAHAADLIPDGARVLTHSRSSTVLSAFKLALKAGKRLSVIVTESRPLLEGRTLAIELSRDGASVALIADAAAGLAVQQAELVLLGADRVSASGVVNKIGSRLIALAAREYRKPIHVVCDTFKFVGSEEFRGDLRQDSSELWSNAPDDIEVLNSYFEATPLSLFTSVITEHGAAKAEEAALLAERFVLNLRLVERLASR